MQVSYFALNNLVSLYTLYCLAFAQQHNKNTFYVQDLKGKILVKGKRLNKLDVALNHNQTTEDGTVSEEDEAADVNKENGQKQKSVVSQICKNIYLCQISCLIGWMLKVLNQPTLPSCVFAEIKDQTC